MIESCVQTIQRGSDLRQVVGVKEVGVALLTPSSVHAAPEPEKGKGMRSVEHNARELLIRITCDLVDLSARPEDTAPPVSARLKTTARSTSLTSRKNTNRSGAMSAPPAPSITIIHEASDPPSPNKQSLPWGAGSAVGSLHLQKVALSKKKPKEVDFLCGQLASSPIAGFPVHLPPQQRANPPKHQIMLILCPVRPGVESSKATNSGLVDSACPGDFAPVRAARTAPVRAARTGAYNAQCACVPITHTSALVCL